MVRPSIHKGRLVARLVFWGGLSVAAIGSLSWMLMMPGQSASEPLAELTAEEQALAQRLEADVRALAERIGERNMHTPDSMDKAANWIEQRLRDIGHEPERVSYTLSGAGHAGESAVNLVAEVTGTQQPEQVVVVGAHYDSVIYSPGANDNASGVAVMLALAEYFLDRPQARTIRFVAFANEEPPFYMSPDMGSHAYAERLREKAVDVRAMIALDGLGYFSTEDGSQSFPAPGIGLAYPDRADFIAFVTRMRDRFLLTRSLGAFREQASIPSEGAVLPAFLPGVGWSDHWSFWQHGYPALLVTDTLPFRDPDYHSSGDTPDRLDYQRMARVAAGLEYVLIKLATPESG